MSARSRADGILLLGHRLGAVRAALSWTRRVTVVHARPVKAPAAEGERRVPVDLGGEARAVASRILDALEKEAPLERYRAVVAVIEGTVLVAAHVRAALGLPGIGTEAAVRCTDKLEMKRAVHAAGVPCTDFLPVENGVRAEDLFAALGQPVVVKHTRSSGSRGLVVARDAVTLGAALGPGRMAERFVSGVEMSVESFVRDGRVQFANPTEYLVPLHANIAPAALSAETWSCLQDLNRRSIEAVGVERGLCHLELFLTPDGMLFGEIAARPPGGRIMPLMARAYGFDPWDALLRLELGEPAALPPRAREVQGVWILHPGAGRVIAIEGLESARALPGVRRVRLRVGAGDRISPRIGSGQDVGYIEVRGGDRDAVAQTLEAAHAALRIELA